MADKRDYYEVLGIDKNADDAAIKKAYRVLAKKYHPDTNPGNAEAEVKFKEASEAYAVLSDPEKRRQYDQFGHAAFDGGAGGGAGGFEFNFEDMGDIFGDIFGSFFGGGGRSRRNDYGPQKGANVRARMRVTFEEAAFGCEKEMEITLKDECPKCKGSGAKEGTSPVTCNTCGGKGEVAYTQNTLFGAVRNIQTCPDCKGKGKVIKDKCSDCYGTGYINRKRTIQVSVPAGISNGQPVRIRGVGEPGIRGGERGDLLVEITYAPHPIFERQDYNVFSQTEISFAQAAIGGDVRIKTLDGDVLFPIKPGTQSGARIRLREKGIPYLRNKQMRGDHIVTLIVKTPEKLNAEQKAALKAFDDLMGGTLNPGKDDKVNKEDRAREKEEKKKKGFFDKKKK